MPSAPSSRHIGLGIASRAIAAIIGGYALATLATLVLAYALPGSRAGALLTGMMLSFALYAAAIIWAFSARTAALAWIGILTCSAGLAAIFILLKVASA